MTEGVRASLSSLLRYLRRRLLTVCAPVPTFIGEDVLQIDWEDEFPRKRRMTSTQSVLPLRSAVVSAAITSVLLSTGLYAFLLLVSRAVEHLHRLRPVAALRGQAL